MKGMMSVPLYTFNVYRGTSLLLIALNWRVWFVSSIFVFLMGLGKLKKMNLFSFIPKEKLECSCLFFSIGLRLPLHPDLSSILEFYGVSLCRYTLGSIGCMVAFIALIRELGIIFSLEAFCYKFILKVMKFEDWISIEAL